MENDGELSTKVVSANGKIETRLLGIVTTIVLALGGWWLQNTWNSIENESRAREALALSISENHVTKDVLAIITAAREKQIEVIMRRLEDNDRHIRELEARLITIGETVATMNGKGSGR